jgi:hypothetical protein
VAQASQVVGKAGGIVAIILDQNQVQIWQIPFRAARIA